MKPINEELELINKYSRRQLKAEEVYIFSIVLCDNETDRDCERFSIPALKTLAGLYVGKTGIGIFDHEAKGLNYQTARIFSAETVSDPERRTRSGEVYTCVRAKAYLMRTEKTADLIAEIDGGIKKEVSVCCSVKKKRCSICGADMMHSPCNHVKGAEYSSGVCEVILEEPTDAYEWSFVAVPVPAQLAADVQEVRHGRWVKSTEHIIVASGDEKEWTNFYCSECDSPFSNPSNYCPNCGARMDGEEE